MASPELSSTPARNIAPATTVCTAGIASPSAQGQVMMRTAIAVTMASCQVAPKATQPSMVSKRRGMHHGRIKPRRAIGQLHIARARLQRILEQPRDLRQQRAFGRPPTPARASAPERLSVPA